MGDFESGGGFPAEMSGVRASDYDSAQACRKKHEGFAEKGLKQALNYAIIIIRDTMNLPVQTADFLAPNKDWGPKDQKEVQRRHEQI